jgi:hypothetical protein
MNCLYHIESVKTSCWYLNYLKPGTVRDLTHELSLSDRFGEFRHWFRIIWLSGPAAIVDNETDHLLATKFGKRQSILANHLCVFRKLGGFPE